MAASSPYKIVLSKEEVRELRRRAGAYSGPWREVVRAKAILEAAEGRTNAEIARRLGVSRKAVSHWRKRFFEEGLEGLEERPRPGRPRRFPPRGGGRGEGDRLRAPEQARPAALALLDG